MDYFWEAAHSVWVGHKCPARGEVLHVRGREQRNVLVEDLPAVLDGCLRFVFISDTHEQHDKLVIPECDALFHCGDVLLLNRRFSVSYSRSKIEALGAWLDQQPAKAVFLIAGNHDHAFQQLGKEQVQSLLGSKVQYLVDEIVEHNGVRIFASPWSRGASANNAFQGERSPRVSEGKVDILMTHGPPPEEVVDALSAKLAVHGHVHERYGLQGKLLNCSIMDGKYNPSHRPIVYDMPRSG
mmetsp:Transcript_15421/g.35205  ORF Transcript_15421/g.35205 Transcript_15421/m.35205 type:complete len:240 (-) Transcript_15421:76-795(-)